MFSIVYAYIITLNIGLPNIPSYQRRNLWNFSRCIFSPCTVLLPDLSLPSNSSFEHSKHFALLMLVSHLVKYSQITSRDDRDIVIQCTACMLATYMNDRLTTDHSIESMSVQWVHNVAHVRLNQALLLQQHSSTAVTHAGCGHATSVIQF